MVTPTGGAACAAYEVPTAAAIEAEGAKVGATRCAIGALPDPLNVVCIPDATVVAELFVIVPPTRRAATTISSPGTITVESAPVVVNAASVPTCARSAVTSPLVVLEG